MGNAGVPGRERHQQLMGWPGAGHPGQETGRLGVWRLRAPSNVTGGTASALNRCSRTATQAGAADQGPARGLMSVSELLNSVSVHALAGAPQVDTSSGIFSTAIFTLLR